MDKLSAAQVQQVLSDTADTLRSLADRNEYLESKLASSERRVGVEKVAHSMHERGIDSDVPIDELIDRLEKMAQTEPSEYRAWERAVDMVGPDMSAKQAQINNDNPSGRGVSAFEQFVVS